MQYIFSTPVEKDSQYLCFHLGRMAIHLESNALGLHRNHLTFHKPYLDDIDFCRLYLVTIIGDLLLCSPSQVSSQEDSIHLLKLLVLRDFLAIVAKEKLRFAQTQV